MTENKSGNNTWKTIKFVLRAAKPQRKLLVCVLMSMFVYVGADFLHPFIYSRIIELVSENQGQAATVFSSVVSLLMALAGALLAHRIFRDAAGFCLVRAEARTMKSVATKAFKHTSNLSYDFHISNFSGSVARDINRGVGAIEDLLDILFYDLTPISVTMVVAVIILLNVNLLIGIPLFLSLIVFVWVTIVMVKKRMIYDRARNTRESKASGVLIDSITNNLTVKTFTGENSEDRLYKKAQDHWMVSAIKAWDWDTWTSIFQGGFIAILEIAMLGISLWLWKQGQFDVGDVVFVQGNVGLLMFPMWILGRFYRNFRRAEVDLSDLIKLTNTKPEIQNLPGAIKLKLGSGVIEFNKVFFNYNDSNTSVLKNLNLKISPGEKIALVGPSGAGKSTFIKLLFRFIEPSKGTIKIDNQDLCLVTIESLRRSVGLVPQEPLLFHRSIAENIGYGLPRANLQQIQQAAKLAHADEFIQGLPKKYDTLVGERGVKLSGGERQRVALARVFLENAPILVLDEATSSLDSISENLIQEALDSLMKERTTIVIAHRLSTIMKMDRILVLDKGQIVETGTHKELISQNSLYKKLWDSQAGKFIE